MSSMDAAPTCDECGSLLTLQAKDLRFGKAIYECENDHTERVRLPR